MISAECLVQLAPTPPPPPPPRAGGLVTRLLSPAHDQQHSVEGIWAS